MKPVTLLVAGALALGSFSPAYAGGPDRDELRAKLAKIIKRLNAWTPPRAPAETVSCSGADGTTVAFSTATTQDRPLSSPVRVKIGGQPTIVAAFQVSTYENEDAGIAMKAYRGSSADPYFTFRTELVPTIAPQTDEVATYAGTVSVNGGVDREVTCSAFRPGAGKLKAQIPESAENIFEANVLCSREAQPSNPVISFNIQRSPSKRFASDFAVSTASQSVEFLSSFQAAQYKIDKSELTILFDDGQGLGDVISLVRANGVRVPTNQPAADPSIYGIWSGTYQRFDAGRELNETVTCYAF